MSDELIRQILADNARLSVPIENVRDASDLYDMGMTSHSGVNVMVALEDAFDVEFPDALLQRSTFASIANIRAALQGLTS